MANTIFSKPVDYPTAKILKDKGYCGMVYNYFSDNGRQEHFQPKNKANYNSHLSIGLTHSRPTIGEVLEWLYEKRRIWIWVEQEGTTNEFEWLCRYENKGSCKDYDDKFYNSPSEAYEAAIEYCLTNLI